MKYLYTNKVDGNFAQSLKKEQLNWVNNTI